MTKEHPFDFEEHYHVNEHKASRKERKALSEKDRSKYKKTDQDKQKATPVKGEGSKVGRVLSIAADGILVDFDGTLYTCFLKGNLKKETSRVKNLIAVGDFVHFTPFENSTGSISHVAARKSVLSRSEQLTRHKQQLIAVNIDQVLITVSVLMPPLKTPLIDRYIIAALKGNMEPVILINKIDLLKNPPPSLQAFLEKEKELYEEVVSTYSLLGIPTLSVSTVTGEGIEQLKLLMKDKASVFSGQSGSGKSSLINILTGSFLRTGEIVQKTGKGSHTTTSTHLLPLEGGGFCIDTPGIKSFWIWDLKKEEVKHYFSEISACSKKCKFQDCTHTHEPECAVQRALKQGKISRLRFDSYCALITSFEEKHHSR